MKCDRCQEQFTDYLEGALPAPRREQVAAHLAQCPDCAGELEAFRRTVAALRGLEAVAPPANLLSRINRAVAAQAQPAQPRFRVSWQHLGAAAAAAALVVGFVAVFSYQRIGPVSERFSGQPAGTVQKPLEQPVPGPLRHCLQPRQWRGVGQPAHIQGRKRRLVANSLQVVGSPGWQVPTLASLPPCPRLKRRGSRGSGRDDGTGSWRARDAGHRALWAVGHAPGRGQC